MTQRCINCPARSSIAETDLEGAGVRPVSHTSTCALIDQPTLIRQFRPGETDLDEPGMPLDPRTAPVIIEIAWAFCVPALWCREKLCQMLTERT